MKSLVDVIKESLNNGVEIIVDRGLKGWLKTIEQAIKIVPKDAIPDVIGSYSSTKTMINRRLSRNETNSYAFSLRQSSVNIPTKYATKKILKFAQEWSQFRNDDDGWNNSLPMRKTINFDANAIGKGLLDTVFINQKYKTPNDVTNRKVSINDKYKNDNDRDYNLNKSGLATLVHEFGHVYDNKKGISNTSEWKEVFFKWKFEKTTAVYVINSESEAFAEAFANYLVSNGDNLPIYVKDYMKKIIK